MKLDKLLGKEPRVGVSWGALPDEVQALADPAMPLPKGIQFAPTYQVRAPGKLALVLLLGSLLFVSPLAFADLRFDRAPLLIGIALVYAALIGAGLWARGRGLAAEGPDWRYGWYLMDKGLLVREGGRVTWAPISAIHTVSMAKSGGSTGGFWAYGAEDSVYVGASEGQPVVTVGFAVKVEIGGREKLIHSRTAVTRQACNDVEFWAHKRKLRPSQKSSRSR